MYAHIYVYVSITMRWGVGCCTVLSGVWGVACSLLGSEAKANKKKLHAQNKTKITENVRGGCPRWAGRTVGDYQFDLSLSYV